MDTELHKNARKSENLNGIGGVLILWLIIFSTFTIGAFIGSYHYKGYMQIILAINSVANIFILTLFFLKKKLFRHLVVIVMPLNSIVELLMSERRFDFDIGSFLGYIVGVSLWLYIFVFLKELEIHLLADINMLTS